MLCAGLEPQGNVVLQPARFTVETLDAGSGEVLVYVQDPEGHTEEVTESHLVPLGPIGSFRVVLSLSASHWVPLIPTETRWVLFIRIGSHCVPLIHIGSHRFPLGPIGSH